MKKKPPDYLSGSRPDLMDGPAWPPLFKKPPTRKQLDGMGKMMMEIYLATKTAETAKTATPTSTASAPPSRVSQQ